MPHIHDFPDELIDRTFKFAVKHTVAISGVTDSLYKKQYWHRNDEHRNHEVAKRLRMHAHSMKTNTSLTLVCKRWNRIAIPWSYKYIVLRRGRKTKLLHDLLVPTGESSTAYSSASSATLGQEIEIIAIHAPIFHSGCSYSTFCSLVVGIIKTASRLKGFAAIWGRYQTSTYFDTGRRHDVRTYLKSVLIALPPLTHLFWRQPRNGYNYYEPRNSWTWESDIDRWPKELFERHRDSLVNLNIADIETSFPHKLNLVNLHSLRLQSRRQIELEPLVDVHLPLLNHLLIDRSMVSLIELDAWKEIGKSLLYLTVYERDRFIHGALEPADYLPCLVMLRKLSMDVLLIPSSEEQMDVPEFYSPEPLPWLRELRIASSSGPADCTIEQLARQLRLFTSWKYPTHPRLRTITLPGRTRESLMDEYVDHQLFSFYRNWRSDLCADNGIDLELNSEPL